LIYGNSPGRWLSAGGLLLGAILLLYIVRRVVMTRLERAAMRTATQVDDFGVDLLRRTKFFFVLALAVEAATHALVLTTAVDALISKAVVVAVAIQMVIWGNGLVTFFIDRYSRRHADGSGTGGVSPTTVAALSYLARFVLFVIVLIVALSNMGIQVTALVTGLGVGGIAIALAIQNILGDLFGALSIVLDKPFVVGDSIAVDQFDGTVEHIGLKTTRLRASSGEQLIFSNQDLLKSRIRNFKRMQERRVILNVNVVYGTPPDVAEQVPRIISEIVRAQPSARFDRSHLRRLGESAMEFETVYYVTTPDYLVFMNTQQAVNFSIVRRFDEAGVAIALPTRVVMVREQGDRGAGDPSREAVIAAAGS
jgi:small-conductance mechanosensitive channel